MSVRAKRSLGQNFLHDDDVIGRIVDALELTVSDNVVEIGPGTGALTSRLLTTAKHVTAIEFDRDLIKPLTEQFSGTGNLELVNTDALHLEFAELPSMKAFAERTKLVANLPYNISTPILQSLIKQRHLFSRLVLMFQREVVERITARPGGRERGYLSVLVEDAFAAEYLFDVPPTAFYPVPKVWSSVVRLTPKNDASADDPAFRSLVSAGFRQKRKTILNNLRDHYDAETALDKAGIDPRRRAETLTLEEWRSLSSHLTEQ